MRTMRKGEVQFQLMKAMNKNSGLTSEEIRKTAKEFKHGVGSFDSYNDRGYYSNAFNGMNGNGYMTRTYGYGWINRLCTRNDSTKKYTLTNSGYKMFKKLEEKFGVNVPTFDVSKAVMPKVETPKVEAYEVIKVYPYGVPVGTIVSSTNYHLLLLIAKDFPEFFKPIIKQMYRVEILRTVPFEYFVEASNEKEAKEICSSNNLSKKGDIVKVREFKNI